MAVVAMPLHCGRSGDLRLAAHRTGGHGDRRRTPRTPGEDDRSPPGSAPAPRSIPPCGLGEETRVVSSWREHDLHDHSLIRPVSHGVGQTRRDDHQPPRPQLPGLRAEGELDGGLEHPKRLGRVQVEVHVGKGFASGGHAIEHFQTPVGLRPGDPESHFASGVGLDHVWGSGRMITGLGIGGGVFMRIGSEAPSFRWCSEQHDGRPRSNPCPRKQIRCLDHWTSGPSCGPPGRPRCRPGLHRSRRIARHPASR